MHRYRRGEKVSMVRRDYLLILVAGVLTTTFTARTTAKAADARLTINDIEKVDTDFAIQGEYSGHGIRQDGHKWRPLKVGLQVVAQGGGEFLGRVYPGGLPGSGWDREHRYVVTGQRDGEQVTLAGEGFQVVINDDGAKVSSVETMVMAKLDRVVRRSPTLGKRPPHDAIVIFNGEVTEHLKNAKVTEDGLLQEGCEITALANDFTLHLEFRLPYMPYARGQSRSNSGVYIHGRYEVQVLDSFGLPGEFNECGALYRYKTPDVNMCLSPLVWQTYDILYLAPKFDDQGKKVKNGRIWVHHNGVPVQDGFEFERATGAGQRVGEGPLPLPIKLQNHSNPVRFRNVWMIRHDKTRTPQSPNKPSAAPGRLPNLTQRAVHLQ